MSDKEFKYISILGYKVFSDDPIKISDPWRKMQNYQLQYQPQ